MASSLATQKKTVAAFLDAYNKWDIDLIMALRAEQCMQYVLPRSLDQPSRNNEEYKAYFSTLMPLFKDFNVTPETTVHDAENHSCAMYLSSTATSPLGPYKNEYTFFLHFTDDGTKIIKVEEMVDSGYSAKYFGDLEKYVASQSDGSSKV
ncbi:hypothetical protein ACLMJK_007979 [Lecanora helva]